MKVRYIILLLLLGLGFDLVGTGCKVCHWPAASALLLAGLISKSVSGVLVLYKLLAHPWWRQLKR